MHGFAGVWGVALPLAPWLVYAYGKLSNGTQHRAVSLYDRR